MEAGKLCYCSLVRITTYYDIYQCHNLWIHLPVNGCHSCQFNVFRWVLYAIKKHQLTKNNYIHLQMLILSAAPIKDVQQVRDERDCPCIFWAHASMISTFHAIPNLVVMIHIIHRLNAQTAAANIQYVCHYNDIGCEEGYTWSLEPNSMGCHDWYVGACVHVFFISAWKIYPIC